MLQCKYGSADFEMKLALCNVRRVSDRNNHWIFFVVIGREQIKLSLGKKYQHKVMKSRFY